MPLYRLQFTAECCLVNGKDVTLQYDGADITFLFSKKDDADRYVRVQTELEAPNNREAQTRAASTLLPPVLDALSFATGTPLLLAECELILKDEGGSGARRAIYVGHKKTPTKVPLAESAIADAGKLLQNKGLRLPLCWLRYALHRHLALDQFVFTWLAFEVLAGDADIPSRCPKCMQEVQHCGSALTHRGASKERAAQIFQSANAETSIREFKNAIWDKARNKVFHGRNYPQPGYLMELFTIAGSLRKAAEKVIAETAGIPEGRPHHRYEELFRVFLFVEWNTSDPAKKFADDWPKAALVERTAKAELNRVFAEAPPANVTFLDYATQSPAW